MAAQTYTVAKGDTLNSIAARYGYSNYKDAGITGYGSNPNLITPGMVLSIGGSPAPTSTPAPAQTPAPLPSGQYRTPSGAIVNTSGALVSPPPAVTDPSITASINAGQTKDYSAASALDAPPTRRVSDIADIAKELKTVLTPSTPAPAAVDYEQKYLGLRTSYGVDSLEKTITDLNGEASAIRTSLAAQRDAERGKPVAMNVIEGRISEEERAANERLALVNDQIKTASDQLQTKYSVINNIMGYAKQTYADAKDTYDTAYTQALNLITTAKGLSSEASTKEEAAKDDARANLQVIYNNLTAGGADASALDPSMRATITKLEMQAGLPAGFYSSLQQKNPKADILSTTTRTTGDKKYADVVMRNSDGSLSTKSIYLGADVPSSSADKTTDEELRRFIYQQIGTPAFKALSEEEKRQYILSQGGNPNDYSLAF